MRAHEIFQRMSAPLAAQIFTFLQTEQKPIYKATIQGLANQRKLRPVFVERKPPLERHAWMHSALSRSISDTFASHVLQTWLLGANKAMLCEFLTALDVKHDDDGTVEELPASPPKEKISAAVTKLFEKYPAEIVAVYLHAFRNTDSTVQWPPLDEILAEDSRLKFG